MKWTPEDTQKPDLLECKKTYDASVITAEEQVSKAGNDMIKLKLAVYATPDKAVTQFVYLLPIVWDKFKAFLASAGLYRQLAAQELTAGDCQGKNCRVIMSSKTNDNGYPEIESFEVPDDAVEKLAAAKEEMAVAPKVALDDLPF